MKSKSVNDNLKKIFDLEVAKIESKLEKLLNNREPKSLYEPCSYSFKSGGKRLRPLLVLISAKAVGGSFKLVTNTALSVELFHNFTLVHDDIMDNSDLRRGRPTLHKKYDVNTAILTGDILVALAYENLLKDCKNNTEKIISTFTKGIVEVCEGQSLDKDFESRNNVTISEYKQMIYKKTAALLEMCCSIGAQICKASIKEIKAVSNYGKNLGMAFQIQDDLLDIVGEENEFGKMIGSDLVEGKKTYLFLRALEKAKGKEKELLLRVIEKKGIVKSEIPLYKTLYESIGVIDDAKKEIVHYTNIALKNLFILPDQEGRTMMASLANALINRSR